MVTADWLLSLVTFCQEPGSSLHEKAEKEKIKKEKEKTGKKVILYVSCLSCVFVYIV